MWSCLSKYMKSILKMKAVTYIHPPVILNGLERCWPHGSEGLTQWAVVELKSQSEGHAKSYNHCKDSGICKDGKPLADLTWWEWHDVTHDNKNADAWQRPKQGEQLGGCCNTQVRKSQVTVSGIRTVALKGTLWFQVFADIFWRFSWQVLLLYNWNK